MTDRIVTVGDDLTLPAAVIVPVARVTGLGDAATKSTGTAAGSVAAGDDSRIVGALPATGLDAAAALLAADPTSALGVLLPSTYVAQADAADTYSTLSDDSRRLRGSLVTIIGSSIARGGDATLGIDAAGTTLVGPSWFSWACALSGQRILRGPNCGVIGNTTAMVLARITDVTAQSPKPDACILYCGSNDAVDGVTAAAYAANVRAITAALRAARVTPILSTIVPSVNSPEYVTCNTYNTILRGIAREEGLQLLDLHKLMIDSATGAQLAAYSTGGDGVHPGVAGYKLMGQYVSDTLSPLMPPALVDLTTDPLDPSNLIVNGLYQGTVTSGKAASWLQETNPAGTTFSVEDDLTFALGRIQRITAAAIASRASIYQYVDPPKFAVGDRIEITFRFRANYTSGSCILRMNFTGAAAPTYINLLGITTSGEGTGRVVVTIPAGTTRLMVMQRVEAGTAVFDLAQMTFRNLTALGIA